MYGDLVELDDGRWQLRFTRALAHPPEKVWRAITAPEHLERWFPTTIEGERAAEAPLRFSFRSGKLPAFHGKMLAFEPESVMEFRWGGDVIRLELQPDGDGTLLTLYDTLEERGKGARDAAGWHDCLNRLDGHLRGEETDGESSTVWRRVHPEYVARFGPEATTIGPPEELLRAE